jgi:hypothetical protein
MFGVISEVKELYDLKWNDDNFQTDESHLFVNEYLQIEIGRGHKSAITKSDGTS